jgi:GntR family transcriptional regulator, transcriptional repressor for pyruvate dehydrogenase complex
MEITSLQQRHTLVDHVVEQVRNNIESGAIKSGHRLPGEFELCTQFGVSRTVIREAAHRLQSLGLIEVRRGRGLYVGSPDSVRETVRLVRSAMSVSLADMEQFTDFRTAMETHTARQAALKATDADVHHLQGLCDKLVDAVEKKASYDAVRKCDIAFHIEIARTAGSHLIQQIQQLVREITFKSMARATQQGYFLDVPTTRSFHQPIVDAIREHDSVRAAAAMEHHMIGIMQRLRALSPTAPSTLIA